MNPLLPPSALSSWFGVLVFWCLVCGVVCGVWCVVCGVWCVVFGVQGPGCLSKARRGGARRGIRAVTAPCGFRGQGSGFRVQGSGFRV
ncbi:hypothetical protein T484DRAFT_2254276 [Baffinella frigidus]|nr:hypothetical protein T484DRAFT_2254276 [Cryptophyta sp. CCMP2293]